MKISKVFVDTSNKKYSIYIGSEIINKTPKLIDQKLKNIKKVAIISDKNVPTKVLEKLRMSLKRYKTHVYKLSSKNKIKNIKTAMYLTNDLLKKNFNRSDCVISLGGGVVGDLAAFVSSITKRGINFINIPTTLLAQVDASVGGKTGINSKEGKNLIGTFHQPEFVVIDISILNSLPHREMISGYGEILKHSLILDKKFFNWLSKNGKKIIKKNNAFLKHAIIKSCKIKTKIISTDEKEKNLRMVLNFGHTFGHAFEATKNFSKTLNHGEAVLLGMVVASEFAYEKKIFPKNDLRLIKKHYADLNLPSNIKNYFQKKDLKNIIHFMMKDKKNFSNKINLILLKKIGKVGIPTKYSYDVKVIKKFINSKINK